MTDPLALDPVLAPSDRSTTSTQAPTRAHDEAYDAWFERFEAHLAAGGTVEATDAMPDEYRTAVLRFVEMHANSELMGVLPEREWLMRAPTLRRKLALTAKVQDEVGHAQLLYRVAEDLGKTREAMFDDLLAGKTKFHNVFHYPTQSWADVGIIAWLVDAAAIVAQQALRDSSYAPYARTMRKICWEESVHIMHGRDVVVTMVTGTPGAARRDPGRARPLVGAADADARPALRRARRTRTCAGGSRRRPREELRQEFLTIYVPRIRELGLVIPDPELRFDEAAGEWRYTEPDWDELRTVVTGHGPMSEERLEFRRLARDGDGLGARHDPGGAASGMTDILGPMASGASPRASEGPAASPWSLGRSSGRRRTATRCATAAASWPLTPSSPRTTRASCSAAARRASGCGSCAAPTSSTSHDPDLLQPPLDRSFKKPGGYVMRDKLAAARAAAGQAKPKARATVTVAGPAAAQPGRRAASGDARDGLEALLRSMADDEFVIGFSDSEWTGIAPQLEEDIAMSSLAQDELGHAHALYGLLAGVTGDGADADALAYDREPADYRHARLLDHGRGDWAMTIARRYLYETADAVRLEALVGGTWHAAGRTGRQARARGALPPDARRRLGWTGSRPRPGASRATA